MLNLSRVEPSPTQDDSIGPLNLTSMPCWPRQPSSSMEWVFHGLLHEYDAPFIRNLTNGGVYWNRSNSCKRILEHMRNTDVEYSSLLSLLWQNNITHAFCKSQDKYDNLVTDSKPLSVKQCSFHSDIYSSWHSSFHLSVWKHTKSVGGVAVLSMLDKKGMHSSVYHV